MTKLNREIESFQKIWKGGYKTGYSPKRNQEGLEIYLKNNLDGKTLLEIGCGGGQWSKFLFNQNKFEKIFCVDVLSEEHNGFWKYLGEDAKKIIDYKKVDDFSLNFLPDESLDFVFSYDVFCHISYSGLEKYFESLYKKCRKGAKLLIMYADAKKYLNSEPENRYHVIKYLPKNKFLYNFSNKLLISDALADKDGEPSSPEYEPRWYWIGVESFLNLCERKGFDIINEDLNIDKTNPITLFKK
ncbi:class I SAM-dependent methyltransferase [Acidimicrobiaceae bacterium]|nr:class I SAM-dependent methyltransferase [Acidimicrobiaceae bacterium]